MDTYGLIGYPLGHSFSRDFFTKWFAENNIQAEYLNFPIEDISQLPVLLEKHPQLRGLNVTIPYKQAVIPLLDEISADAKEIGAVNVIRITQRDGKPYLQGFNSDIIGFSQSIRPLLQPHHHQALILGTGGASKAIRTALDNLGIRWKYVSRTPREGMFSYQDITSSVIRDFPLIINCSPVGMFPHTDECPPIPYEAISGETLLYDLVYNPTETLFLQRGAVQGAQTKNGLEMLYLQAIASWDFFQGDSLTLL